MIYDVKISAKVESKLKKEDLERNLVIALHNIENGFSKLDGVDGDLEVIDYDYTDAVECN
jgi:hypothetical protein